MGKTPMWMPLSGWKQYDLPLHEGCYTYASKKKLDKNYLETSFVHSKTWTDPSPVTPPHLTWKNGVRAALELGELFKQGMYLIIRENVFLSENNAPFYQQTQSIQKFDGTWN